MSSRWRGPGIAAAALCLALAAVPPNAAEDPVQAFADELHAAAPRWSAERFSARVDDFGKLVGAARESAAGAAQQARLRALGDELHAACRARIRALEAATAEDEAALEALYRSDQWHAINYALAGVRYWQAWIDLALAENAADDSERVPALSNAERGFQATAVRILYPGLVYGSWLGMAYVARIRGDDATVEQRLKLLAGALAADPGNPLTALVEEELTLLAVRRGDTMTLLPEGKGDMQPAVARRLQEEAFMLLQRRRKEGIVALDAAERLRRVIDAGYLDDALLARMLDYRNELVGRDIGVIGLLLDAEYAAASEQYETTVLKYREFAARGGFDLPLALAPFRYNYAAALHRLGYEREALEVAGRLRDDASVGPAARKLVFLVADALNRHKPDATSRERLARAARDYLQVSPADKDAAYAHLALATAGGADAEAHLAAARRDPRTRAAVASARLDAAVAAFGDAAARNDPGARAAAARRALEALGALPRAQRRQMPLRVLALQMRVASGDVGERSLRELQELRAVAGADAGLQRVLAWTALRALTGDALLAHIDGLPSPPSAADATELLSFLLERERAGDPLALATLCAHALPAFATQPDTARQLMLLRYRAFVALGRHADAFALATAMVQASPDSGDAWQAYAEAAEQTGDGFAADRAWARIAASVPEGSGRWLDASLRRVAVLTRTQGARADHCALLAAAGGYLERMSAAQRTRMAALMQDNACDAAANGEPRRW